MPELRERLNTNINMSTDNDKFNNVTSSVHTPLKMVNDNDKCSVFSNAIDNATIPDDKKIASGNIVNNNSGGNFVDSKIPDGKSVTNTISRCNKEIDNLEINSKTIDDSEKHLHNCYVELNTAVDIPNIAVNIPNTAVNIPNTSVNPPIMGVKGAALGVEWLHTSQFLSRLPNDIKEKRGSLKVVFVVMFSIYRGLVTAFCTVHCLQLYQIF